MASKGTTIQAIKTTTTATTTRVHNRSFARAKGQLLSGTSADEATSKAAVMTTQAPTTTAAIFAAMPVCRSNWAVAVEQTKYRTRNETTNSQLIERINVQQQLQRRQQQHRQQQHIVGFEKRPTTQKQALKLQKHSPKGAATLPTMRIAIKAKTAKTTAKTATTSAAIPTKLLLSHATATAT